MGILRGLFEIIVNMIKELIYEFELYRKCVKNDNGLNEIYSKKRTGLGSYGNYTEYHEIFYNTNNEKNGLYKKYETSVRFWEKHPSLTSVQTVEGYYENGEKVGFWKSGETFDLKNKILSDRGSASFGTLWVEGNYEKGKKVGIWNFYENDIFKYDSPVVIQVDFTKTSKRQEQKNEYTVKTLTNVSSFKQKFYEHIPYIGNAENPSPAVLIGKNIPIGNEINFRRYGPHNKESEPEPTEFSSEDEENYYNVIFSGINLYDKNLKNKYFTFEIGYLDIYIDHDLEKEMQEIFSNSIAFEDGSNWVIIKDIPQDHLNNSDFSGEHHTIISFKKNEYKLAEDFIKNSKILEFESNAFAEDYPEMKKNISF